MQFVRDHQRAIERIALAVDSKLASLAPHIGEHFLRGELKSFSYAELDAAVAWAAARSATVSSPATTTAR